MNIVKQNQADETERYVTEGVSFACYSTAVYYSQQAKTVADMKAHRLLRRNEAA